MKTLLKVLMLAAAWLMAAPAVAAEAVPVNATFGIQWTPIDWNPAAPNPFVLWHTRSQGAAGLPNGKVLAVDAQDELNPLAGTIQGQAALFFSYDDGVLLEYSGAAEQDPLTRTASFYGPMTVVKGWGRFEGATGSLTIRSNILFPPFVGEYFDTFVGTFDIKGVIKTAK
jgi:hypothetical protein